jgi:trk system potassium uptake protein
MSRNGSPPGDRLVRVERVQPMGFRIAAPRRVRKPQSPAAVLILGFASLIAVGTVVLMLPVSSAAGTWTVPMDALFTATSAVCVTGLVVLDTGTYWSSFGHLVIAVLIQVGGFGFMTGSTLLLFILVGRRTGLRDRMLVQASTGVPQLGEVTTLLRRIAVFTIAAELTGAAVLAVVFAGDGLPLGQAAWWGVFHAVSSFNNAGFDLTGGFRSITAYATNPVLLGSIGLLIILGGLGFAIVGDAVTKRRWNRFALETKIVLLTTVVLLVLGAVTTAAFEWDNPATLGALPEVHRATNALFQSITYRTAGFAAIDPGGLTEAGLFVGMALMFIGAASGSTAGGIKVNTFSVLLATIISTARGRRSTEAFGRRIPDVIVFRALSVALLAVAIVFGVALLLEAMAPELSFVDVLFEAVSAFGTVGLTTGITPAMPDPARLVLIGGMFVGRLGPLTLVLALAARSRASSVRPASESMRIG